MVVLIAAAVVTAGAWLITAAAVLMAFVRVALLIAMFVLLAMSAR
jgi:hypothetical protein